MLKPQSRLRALLLTATGLMMSLGPAARPVEGQDGWGAQLLVDRWSSEESGTNVGVGVRRMGSWNRNVGFVVAADVVPLHLDTPDGQNRKTYLDLELGLLFRRAEWPVYAGWSIGYLYANPEGGAIGPVDSGAQIVKLGWMGESIFVEAQRWFGAQENALAGEGKGSRWVFVLGSTLNIDM